MSISRILADLHKMAPVIEPSLLACDFAELGQEIRRVEKAGARLLRAAGAASVDVAVTHALFAGDALQALHDAGVGEVWSTDCIPHASNAVPMAEPLAQALRSLLPA